MNAKARLFRLLSAMLIVLLAAGLTGAGPLFPRPAHALQSDDLEYRQVEPGEMSLGPEHDGILFGSKDTTVFAIELATGDVLWRYVAPAPILSRELIGGELFAWTFDPAQDALIALNPVLGQERWRIGDLPHEDVWGIYVSSDGVDLVVVDIWTEFGTFIEAVDATTGADRWTQNLINNQSPQGEVTAVLTRSGPATSYGVASSGSWSNYSEQRGLVMMLDQTTGWPIWSVWADRFTFTAACDESTVYVLAAPDNAFDQLNHLLAIDAGNGSTRWETTFSSPVMELELAGDSIAVQTANGIIEVMDSANGVRRWSVTPDKQVNSIGLNERGLYTIDAVGVISARSPEDGALVWERAGYLARTIGFVSLDSPILITVLDFRIARVDTDAGDRLWSAKPLFDTVRGQGVPNVATPPPSPPSAGYDDAGTEDTPFGVFVGSELSVVDQRDSEALDIDDHGQIVGSFETESHARHAAVWTNGLLRDLRTLGGEESVAYAINDAGQIVGGSQTESGVFHAFIWTEDQTVDLHPSGFYFSLATDINSSGEVVGMVGDETGQRRAAVWRTGVFTMLPDFGGTLTQALAVNDEGLIVGLAATPNNEVRAVLWENDLIVELSTQGFEWSQAWDINNSGQIVGAVLMSSGYAVAAVWQEGGDAPTLLSTPSQAHSLAYGINDDGFVVGKVQPDIGESRAALWSLDSPDRYQLIGYSQGEAMAISSAREIVGSAGSGNAVVWRPEA